MKRIVITLMAACLLLGAGLPARAQDTEYKATPVTISRDRVRKDGKLFYSHVVLERQTLFSISKAYGVTIQDIYDANPTLNLEKEGLKTYQILMIPVVDNLPAAQEETAAPAPQAEKPAATDKPSVTYSPQSGDYIVHTVKWYEDLGTIAKKYGVSREVIMRVNGMTSPAVSRKQKLLIPMNVNAGEPVVEELPPVTDEGEEEEEVEEEKPKSIFETIGEAISEKAEEWLYAGKKDITAALIMPFNAQKSPSENNLEFYSGVLLAAYDLKSEGINVDLSVYDAVGGNIPVSADKLSDCDVVIGPVSTADLTSTLRIAPSGTTIVSPLEPKAVDLARMYGNLVQAPSSAENQSEDLIDWLAEDFRTGDKIILLTEKNVTLTSAAGVMVSKLQESGLPYSTISYGVPEGRSIVSSIESSASQGGATRLVVASESEAFVSDVVRNANLLALRNSRRSNIVLYGLSKIRSFDTIEIESLHNTNLHVAISYFVDYDSPAVQKFLMSYRALFNAEPGPFAFQGYDTAYNFMKMSSRYGRRWADKLDDEDLMRGLQSNFRFDHRDAHVNKAVRRVVYGPDFSIRLVN
jgi:LysM repeat protein/ABC-type branched-subunit amino acid transport system substrate-binding protein